MNAIFLDTGYVLALELANDQNHESAIGHWHGVRASRPSLLTTSYVFAEIVTFLNRRGFHPKAVQIGTTLLSSPTIELVHVDRGLFDAAWDYFRQHADKIFSLTDCVSFTLMKDRGIAKALTFDGHFRQAGFQNEP